MAKITLDEIQLKHHLNTYEDLVLFVQNKIDQKKLSPIKSNGVNGKSPLLYNAYRILEKELDDTPLIHELEFDLDFKLSNSYYLSHLKQYRKERMYVLKLNTFFKKHQSLLNTRISLNERSFQIFQEEKFLSKKGTTILKHCGLSLDDLNIYETTVPLTYYSYTKDTPQTILITENMDPFYSMRFMLINNQNKILGTDIGTVVYGAGKGIIRSFEDFDFYVEDYMSCKDNTIYYWGDLDYEGISIYESLKKAFLDEWDIVPFKQAYLKMLEKSIDLDLPTTKDGQLESDDGIFFSYFDEVDVKRMKQILKNRTYIPQEILNKDDYAGDL